MYYICTSGVYMAGTETDLLNCCGYDAFATCFRFGRGRMGLGRLLAFSDDVSCDYVDDDVRRGCIWGHTFMGTSSSLSLSLSLSLSCVWLCKSYPCGHICCAIPSHMSVSGFGRNFFKKGRLCTHYERGALKHITSPSLGSDPALNLPENGSLTDVTKFEEIRDYLVCVDASASAQSFSETDREGNEEYCTKSFPPTLGIAQLVPPTQPLSLSLSLSLGISL